jgi:hypothetical protein
MPIESLAVILGIIVIAVSVVLYLRSQRGGAGPEVGYVPGFLRGIANAWFGVMDWPIPFDRSGQLIPVAQRRRARER